MNQWWSNIWLNESKQSNIWLDGGNGGVIYGGQYNNIWPDGGVIYG